MFLTESRWPFSVAALAHRPRSESTSQAVGIFVQGFPFRGDGEACGESSRAASGAGALREGARAVLPQMAARSAAAGGDRFGTAVTERAVRIAGVVEFRSFQ